MRIHWDKFFQGVALGLVLITGTLLLGGCSVKDTTKDFTVPKPTNYVVDEANVIDDSTELSLNEKIRGFTAGEIGVLTVKTTQPYSIEEYGIKVADQWKVGKAGLDNGAILIVATEDRKVRIEVGRGTEALLTDGEAGSILDNVIVPKLKSNDFVGGISAGVDALIVTMSK